MKKRFLSVFMALCMVLGLLPTAAAAADVSSAQMLADALGGAACATVSGDTVTMQQNVTLTDTITITSGTVVLDLNGHTMTGKAGDGSRLDYNYACGKTALAITGGALTIRDSASGGKVIGGNGSGSAYLWADGPVGGGGLSVTGGAVTISGGTLEGGVGGTQTRFIGGRGGFGIFVESGMVSVTGGTFTGGAGGGGGNGSGAQGSAVVINGGSVDGTLGAAPKNDSGTELQLYTLTVNRAVDSPLAGTAVTALTATDKLGYTYGMTGVKTDADGKLYVYLPAGKTAFSVTADRVTYSGSVTENTAALLPPPTAAEYAAASPAAAADTDYVLDTEAKTLAIRTAKGAAFFSANGAAYRDYTVKLDADVDVGGFLWTPVCNLGTPFTGSFDGQNHTISKLTVAAMNGGCAGVFGRVGYSGQTPAAAVKNLTVTGSVNVSGSGSCYVGGIVGYNYGLIDHCTSSAQVTVTSQGGSSQSYAGGIVGSNSKGTIRSCRNSGALTAASSYMTCAGGIAGDMSGGSAANCFGTGAVSAGGGSGTNYAGGIAGDAFNSAAFTNCYSTGAVTASGTGTAAGGICGSESGNSVPVTNCFWLSTAADKLIGASQTTEITGCGTFADSTGALTAGTAENCGSVQTLAYGAELLAALNGWVTARASADYLTWAADSTSAPANDGYPVINVPEARWGTDDTCAAGRGTVTDAVTYANGLAGGTAYIQLLSGAKTTRMLEFSSGRTTVLDLNGFDIDRGSTTESESSVLDVQGSLTLRDTSANAATAPGKIKGGRFVHIGGVSVSKDGSLVMEGGSITGNTACGGSGGGGVRVDGSFVMTGGSITGNTCKSGGGGGVYVSGGSFTMTGGSITENSADLNGGGVYVSGGSLALGGAAEITGNTRVTGSTSAPDNVCLADGRTIAISPALTNTTPIGVNMQTPGVFTSGSAVKNSDYLAKFTADSADCAVRAADNSQLRLVPAYAVTKAAPVNGSFTVKTGDSEVLRAAEGDLVTITPAANSGYMLDNITVTKTGDTAATVSVTTDTFTMPAYAVTVTVSFTPDVPSSPPPSSSPGGSAGSSSGGGGGTTAPTVTVPVSSDAGKASVSASVTSGTASVTVTDSQLKTIVSDSTGTVKVDVSGLKNVTAAAVSAKVVEAAAKAGGGTGLAVSVPNGSVALDSTALGAVNTGSTVVVSVDPVAHEKLSETQKSVVPENAVIVDVNVLVNGAKVHDFNGGRITVSVPYTPAANEDTAALTVWYLDDAGGVTPMHGYFDAQTGAVVFTTTHLSQYVIARFPFADVAESSYAYTAVAWAVENGVTQGVGAASFAPEGVCSRAEAATFLWRALGSPEPTGTDCPFADVSADAYYYKAVLWAAEKGIAVGTSAAGFSPSDTVTRAQALTFLWRAAGKPAADAANPFADVDAGAYYRSAVLWAVGRGVTNGTAADAFSPALGCTRAQIAAFLYRQLGK